MNFFVLSWMAIVICYSELLCELLLWIANVNCYCDLLPWIATVNCYCELLLWNIKMNYFNERKTREGEMKLKALIQGKDNVRWNKTLYEQWTIIMREVQGKEWWNMKPWYKGRRMWGEWTSMSTMKQKALIQGKENVKKTKPHVRERECEEKQIPVWRSKKNKKNKHQVMFKWIAIAIDNYMYVCMYMCM